MNLPSKEKKFYFDHTNDFGERYEGYFTIKCRLTCRERQALELEKTRLMGGYDNPTDGLLSLAIILSNLDVKIIDAPEWWKQNGGGRDLDDEDIVGLIFQKVADIEKQWHEDLVASTAEKIAAAQAIDSDPESDDPPKSTGEKAKT